MPAAGTLTVVTLNAWKCDGDYFARVHAIADGLKALEPDIVLLQEVFATADGALHTGEAVRERLRMTHVHAPARPKPRSLAGQPLASTSGLSILTSLPILEARTLALPDDPADGERIAQIATLDWDGGALAVVNTHLTHLADADDLRTRQLAAIAEAIPEDGPAILGGDLNAAPGDAPLRWLEDGSGFAVADAWEAAGGPIPTLTGADGRSLTGGCIDHLFAFAKAGAAAPAITDAGRVLDTPDPATGTLPSDHAGVRAVFRRT